MMPSFDDTVVETIEEIIRNVFEDNETAELILHCLNSNTDKPLDERLQIFTAALPKILGLGYVIIEDLILETLYSKYGLTSVFKKDNFASYIKELSKHNEAKSE